MHYAMATGLLLAMTAAAAAEDAGDFVPLFPDGKLSGWHFSDWSDLETPQQVEGTPWEIEDGVLKGLGKRTWIYSNKDFGDFVLKFDWRISKGANGGLGLRFPPEGDPAYRGLEIQMVDGETYYRNEGRPEQLTGAIYDAVAPKDPRINPVGEWNTYEVTCRGDRVTIVLNGETVVDAKLSQQTEVLEGAKEGTTPLAERPRSGRIGFQNLNGTIDVRKPMIRVLRASEEK